MLLLENVFGWLALVTTLIGLIPQIIKAYKSKSTKDLSKLYLLNYLMGSLCWIFYGFLTSSLFVVYSNIFGTTTCLFLIFQKYQYDQRSS